MSRFQRFGFLILILLLGFWLRLFLLDSQSLWWDEGISLHLATSSFREIIADRITNIHPPLYFFLLKIWVALTGTSAFAARYSSVLGSFLQMALVYAVLRRWFGRGTAVIGLILTAVWSLSIIYAQEVRVYAFLPLVYLLLVLLTQEAVAGTPSKKTWLWLGVAEWVALHLHYNALFLLIFLNGWAMLNLWRQRRLLSWLKVQGGVGLASLPWAIGVLLNWSAVQAEASLAGFATQPPAWDFVLPQVWGFHLTGLVNVLEDGLVRPFSKAFLAMMTILILGRWWVEWRRGEGGEDIGRSAGRLLLFWLGPLFLGFAVWLVRSYSHPRYISLFAAGFVLLLAFVLTPRLSALGRWASLGNLLRAAAAVLFIWLSGWGLQHYFFDPAFAKDDMRGVAKMLAETAVPDDLILLPDAGYALQYAYDGETPLVMPQVADSAALWQNFSRWSAQPRRLFRVMAEADATLASGPIPFALESSGWLMEQLEFAGLKVAVYQLVTPITQPAFTPKAAHFGSLQLTGVWLEQGAAADTAVSIALSWQKTTEDETNYHAALRLVDIDRLPLTQWDELLLDEQGRPSGLWPLHQSIITYHRIPIAPGTPPLPVAVDLSLYRLDEAGEVELANRLDQSGQHVTLGEATLSPAVGVENPYGVAGALPALPQARLLGDGLMLEAIGLDRGEIAPGQSLLVALRWLAAQNDLPNYEPRIALEQNGETLVESVTAPALGRYPTALWQAGEVVVEHRFLPIPATAEGVAQLIVQLDEEKFVYADVTITATARQFAPPQVGVPVHEQLGELALLVGYDLSATEVAANEPLPVTLIWQAVSPTVAHNYAVFVHLLDENGRLIGQHDGQPVNNSRPTVGWVSGEYLVDLHEIMISDPAYGGRATIAVGMYDPATGERLLTPDGNDFIALETAVSLTPANE